MENNNTNKGKLTLKLKLSNTSNPKELALKNAENKRISNSMVQISVKGRKNNAVLNSTNQDSRQLSNAELKSRKLALDNIGSSKDEDYDILSKIKNKTAQDLKNKEDDNKIQEIAKQPESTKIEEVPVETTPKNEEVPVENTAKNTIPDYNVDNFNIRDKIKKSVDIDNVKKEERQKIIEERKRTEIETTKEQERLDSEKKSKFKKNAIPENNNDFNKKKNKFTSKEKRKGNRRMLQTFIVDGDSDGSGYGGRRKKQKVKIETKEYVKITKDVKIPELISVSDLSDRMSEKTGDVVKKLFTMGVVATSNQVIDTDTAELIVQEFGHNAIRVQDSDVENILESNNDNENIEKISRAPVVTIMGHVDHGKTSLLDAMKSTNIVDGEHGGITQHIGASRIETNSGKFITFLDTPGHEAFTQMRLRGANSTDIVILVVAADDGIKEQTIEAINHAKAANAPIIVAINKIDKPEADVNRVKNELLAHEIVAEDLGGDVMFVEVSAKAKTNLDLLEEAILLQAEILELTAPLDCKANGTTIEATIDNSKGVMATLLVQEGTLNIGDIIVAGTSYGKIKKMTNDKGKNLKTATPSMPIEVLGLDKSPNAGDGFSVVKEEKYARDIISYRSKKERDEKALKNAAKSIDDIFKQNSTNSIKYLPIIIKADVHGSVEAIETSLMKLNTDEVAIKIIHRATGGITESDVSLAEVTGAIIIGFNVRSNNATKEMAHEKNIDIRYHAIIYNVVDELKLLLGGMLEPIRSEEHLGQAEIRQIFKVSGAGKIAGCFVTSGLIKKGAKVRLLRDNIVIHDGALKTLKRFKDDVKEVKNNFECGCAFEKYDDIKEGDIIECYEIIEKNRKL